MHLDLRRRVSIRNEDGDAGMPGKIVTGMICFVAMTAVSPRAALATDDGGILRSGWMRGASISVGPDGVSITLPEAMARGNVAALAEAFLNRHAPGMCSHLFNFEKPHAHLTVGVTVMAQPDARIPFWAAGTTHSVVIDYVPARSVHCIVPQDEDEPTN
jgi:hypothetical protein